MGSKVNLRNRDKVDKLARVVSRVSPASQVKVVNKVNRDKAVSPVRADNQDKVGKLARRGPVAKPVRNRPRWLR